MGLCSFGTVALALAAAIPPAKVVRPPTGFARAVLIWPKGAPGALGNGDADNPKMYIYPALGEGEHPAVIVLPGGGYNNLSTENEGAAAARWLSQRGVTAFVLTYRLGPRYAYPVPMEDGARAVRYVRSRAAELGIDKNKVGLWGFSAGGHLAAYIATTHDAGDKKAADPIDRESDRPDFVILSYARLTLDPAIPRKTSLEALIGKHPSQELLDSVSLERHVTSDTPPCFLFATGDDEVVNPMNSTTFYNALKRAGVQAELHIFERGPHGLGLAQGKDAFPELAIYPALIANWMQTHHWMPETVPEKPREARTPEATKHEKQSAAITGKSTKTL